MTAKELKRIFSKGECLSLDTMRLYNDGKLNKKSMHEVEKHLLECNLCSGAVDGLNNKRLSEVNKLSEHIQRRLAVYMNTPPTQPFFRRFGWLMISAILLISVSGTCIYIAQSHSAAPVVTDSSSIQKNGTIDNSNTSEKTFLPSSIPSTTVSDVQVNSSSDPNATENKSTAPASKVENLPADLPGQPNTFTIKQESATSPASSASTANDPPSSGPTTRSENSPVRVKSVLIYPATAHDGKTSRKESKDGQLGTPSDNSTSGFQLDEVPTFPGGNEALRNYIMTNFKPTMADREKLTRFATGVRFVVNSKTGAISAPEVSFSISPEIDKELLRVINSIPNYNPGKKRGEVDIMIGITFE